MKRYPSPKLDARMQFLYLKTSVKNWTKKNVNILETAGNIKVPRISALGLSYRYVFFKG